MRISWHLIVMRAESEVELLLNKGVIRCTRPMAPFLGCPWPVTAIIKRIYSIKGVMCIKRDSRSHVEVVLSSLNDR